MQAAIYEIASGRIQRRVNVPADFLRAQVQPGEELYRDCPANATHIIDGEPAIIAVSVDALAGIRVERDQRLAACDWTQLPDARVDIGIWAVYRQALRDFPTVCDPDNPVWPTPPA